MRNSGKPNIIIFMADQWRGDCTGVSGHPLVKTPNVDRMAADGLVFTQVFTVNPICTPTRASCCYWCKDLLCNECVVLSVDVRVKLR